MKGQVCFLQVRFHFDKAGRNFSVRKFSVTNDPHLNAVKAAIHILHCADLLKVPLNEPMCAFLPEKSAGSFKFLTQEQVTKVLRAAVVAAYPDENHYLHLNLHCIMSHSHCVTAAVCLHLAGCPREEIAWRLRWGDVQSVPVYLRDCFQDIGEQVKLTLTGALKTSDQLI